ncbi:mas-related G-protein coupled receptor member A6-like [Perca fluviatilis]|uniref:mas-related G-protein coupled receptor member A6-like n=1 Tax=Perca fluviatilis TaxID=8168 RepID=UPI0019626375|nr:mas-related G-protein coupled receptor member A6-like [Perca fluviatilis]
MGGFNNNDTSLNNSTDLDLRKIESIIYVMTCIIICIGLPLTLVAIYALYSLVGKYNVAPISVINLLISDLVQFCCLIIWVAQPEDQNIYKKGGRIYGSSLLASVGFMLCIALERYLVIACPLWYRFRRSIKISVVVCVLVGKDHVAPIYVINLLISDLIQFCCMIVRVAKPMDTYNIGRLIYFSSLMASVCFMVCIALERYLVIACPLWYRFRRTIKISVVPCLLPSQFQLMKNVELWQCWSWCCFFTRCCSCP